MKILTALLLTTAMVACGTDDETEQPPMTAMCKTISDGTVHRVEPKEDAHELRKVLTDMGFHECY